VHRNGHSRINKLYRIGRTLQPHCEMIANAYQHDIDLVISRYRRHIGKQIRVSRVIKGWPAADRNDQSARVSAIMRQRIFVFLYSSAVPRWYKRYRDLMI